MFAVCPGKKLKKKERERIVNLCCIVISKRRIIPKQERTDANVKSIHHERT